MKRRRILLLLLGSVVAVALAILFWPREREPEYNGVSLSAWLDRTRGRRFDDEFAKAIDHIGTNALPILLRSVGYQIPRWKFWLRSRVAQKLPAVIVGSRPIQWLLDDTALRRADAAVIAF